MATRPEDQARPKSVLTDEQVQSLQQSVDTVMAVHVQQIAVLAKEASLAAGNIETAIDQTQAKLLTPAGAVAVTGNEQIATSITAEVRKQLQTRKGDHTTILRDMIADIEQRLPAPVSAPVKSGVIPNIRSMGTELTATLDSSMLSFLQMALSLSELKDAAWHLKSIFSELGQTFFLIKPEDQEKYMNQTALQHMREHFGKACSHLVGVGTSLNGSLRDFLRSFQKSSLATWHMMEAIRYGLDAIASIPGDALKIARIPYDLVVSALQKTQEALQRFDQKMREVATNVRNAKPFAMFHSKKMLPPSVAPEQSTRALESDAEKEKPKRTDSAPTV